MVALRKGVFGCGKGQPKGELSASTGSLLIVSLVGVSVVPVGSHDENQIRAGAER